MIEFKLEHGYLLRKAVIPLVEMAETGVVQYSPEEISLTARDDMNWAVSAEVRFRSSDFSYFNCNGCGVAGVNLELLYKTLKKAGEEDSVTVLGEYGDGNAVFLFENRRTHQIRPVEMELTELHNQELPDESEGECDVVVAIPSEDFRGITKYLHSYWEMISITVTDTQVKFTAANEDVVVKKEHCVCIIGGAVSDDPVHLSFNLSHIGSLLNASLMSDMVWILRSNISCCVLNFPVGHLEGNLLFKFREDKLYVDL